MSQKKVKLNELDFNNIGGWPQNYKIGFCVLIGAFILVLAYLLVFKSQGEELEGLESQESTLRAEFEQKAGRASNLAPLKQQLAQMEQVLQQMLRQLPSKTEMPDLIVDISQTALSSGLTNELFQPGSETPKEFYVETPIALRMVGSYHQFGAFVSGVASLPRVVILTMHDISLQPVDAKAGITGSGNLELSGTVKTYRYMDEEETAAQEKAAAGTQPAGAQP
jgi:type IV pilus assembly protein PilO